MDKQMFFALLDSFIKVLIITRVTKYLVGKIGFDYRKMAYIVFFVSGIIMLIGLFLTFKNVENTISVWLYYYVPFLVMWLLKDLMEASRKKKQQEASEINE